MTEKEETIKLPGDTTLKNASKLSIQEDKPIMLDYWMDSCDESTSVMIGVKTNDEKLLVRSSEEFTSPISKIYKVGDDYIIMTSDVTSFYPNMCIRNQWSPAHFPKEEFCDKYEWFFNERVKIPKSNPMNYVYKIILNSTFGLSNEENSFFYDPELCMRIPLNGQLSLMMLYDMLLDAIPDAVGLLQNTDGVEIRIPRDMHDV